MGRNQIRRIIPAYAGSTRGRPSFARPARDHPRIRGEHAPGYQAIAWLSGSSPHTRGARSRSGASAEGIGIIPAYAGSTASLQPRSGRGQDHPRIRGEHSNWSILASYGQGSSPHTRGAHRRPMGRHQERRIIPAYAGSTLGNPCNTKDRRRDYTSFPLPVTHPSGGGGS